MCRSQSTFLTTTACLLAMLYATTPGPVRTTAAPGNDALTARTSISTTSDPDGNPWHG
ncbi:hypothetical protein SAMN05444320_105151 [Streptoalloteichus hindustanus]|uniref:Uncharacterized protein n=1 Tax=Streptoalloteichus hindustanus TaxID=2017 RepID=A0A1M5EVA2_STRHI|nr:hypothetical protein SAMN05444320_105151 [Streptoalloteichus hindustanus]